MGRCWPNYKPAPGKTAYSKGSCIPRQTSAGFKMKGFPMYSYGDSANSTADVKPTYTQADINKAMQDGFASFENPSQQMIDQARELGNNKIAEHMAKMKEYRDHQANSPQFQEGDSFGGHFNTYMKKVVHNMTGPANPNLVGGAGGLELVGGLVKGGMGAIKAIKHLLKSGGKKYVTNKTKQS